MERNTSKTLEKILNATEDIISNQGCDSFTFKKLMDKTHLSKGAIFHHVDSKNHLFILIFNRYFHELDGSIESIIKNYSLTLEEKIHYMTEAFFCDHDPYSPFNQTFKYLLSQDNSPEVSKIIMQFKDLAEKNISEWIECEQKKGRIKKSLAPGVTAILLNDMIVGFRILQGFNAVRDKNEKPEIERVFYSLLSNQPS